MRYYERYFGVKTNKKKQKGNKQKWKEKRKMVKENCTAFEYCIETILSAFEKK